MVFDTPAREWSMVNDEPDQAQPAISTTSAGLSAGSSVGFDNFVCDGKDNDISEMRVPTGSFNSIVFGKAPIRSWGV